MRLTPAQIELLTDIATKPQMFVRRWGRWGKTARVLRRLGLAEISIDVSPQAQDMVTITEAGRAEYDRRMACSFPGCGKPTAYLQHADGGPGWGWRHLDPADESDTHVGYPMPREPKAGAR